MKATSIALINFIIAFICVAVGVAYVALSYPTSREINIKVQGFLENPKLCESKNLNYFNIAKKIKWNSESMMLRESINSMPKKISYVVLDRSSMEIVANLSYRVDAGCGGLWISVPSENNISWPVDKNQQ